MGGMAVVGRDREFTTFITAEVAPTAEAEAKKLERIYDRTFSNIQVRAAAASRATAGLVGGGMGTARTASTMVSDASRVAAANQSVFRSSAVTTAQLARHGNEIGRLEHKNQALVNSLRSSATALQVVQGPLGPMAGRITALSNAMERLTGFRLGIAAVGAALFGLTIVANQAAQIRQKLSPLYETQEQVNAAFSRTVTIARETKTALEPVVDLYSRLTLVGRPMGMTPQTIDRTTRAALLGARISGGSRESQAAAITQLGQGIGSNRLGGDELRSIVEQAPRIAKAIADGLSGTEHFGHVTLGMLRNLGTQGELTAQRVAGALGRELHNLEEESRRLGPAMASSMSSFGTQFTRSINNLDRAVGLTLTMATTIQFAADNMRELTALTLGLAVAWAAVKIMPNLQQRGQQLRAFINAQNESFQVQRAAAIQQQASATQMVTDLGRQNTALAVQRGNIEANIVALQAEAAAARANVARLAPEARIAPQTGAMGIAREHAEQVERLRAAEQRLMQQERLLTGVQANQSRTSTGLAQATTRMAAAKDMAARSASRLKFWGANLLQMINPLGIAVAIATAALFEFAMAESRAERDAKRLEEVQRQLADSFDETTGRIREQNNELRAGIALRADEAGQLARRGFQGKSADALRAVEDAIRVARDRVMPGTGEAIGPQAPQLVAGPNDAGGRRIQELLGQVRSRQISILQFARELEALAHANPGNRRMQDAMNALLRQLPNLQDAANAQEQAEAQARVARGSTTAEDLRRSRGDFSRGRVEGMTPAQIAAAARAEADRLRDRRYAAAQTRDRAMTELGNRSGQMSGPDVIRERAAILRTYDQEIESIQRAEQAEGHRGEAAEARNQRLAESARDKARQLADLMQGFQDDAPVRQLERVFDQAARARRQIQDLVGETVDGIGRFSAGDAQARIAEIEASVQRQSRTFLDTTLERFQDDTPIRRLRTLAHEATEAKRSIDALVGHAVEGYQNGFTQADADRLKGGVDAYVEQERIRPLTEMLRASQEQLQVNGLILQGREDEARALERAFQLRRDMVDVDDATLRILVEQEQRETRVNDLLAARQRVVQNLVSVAEDARQTIEEAVGSLERGRPDRAVQQFFSGMMSSYFRVQARQLTEQLMQGTDQRITDLVNGRVRVDTAVGDITNGMTTAGSAAMTFANRLQAATAVLDAARADVAAPAGLAGADAIVSPGRISNAARVLAMANPLANMIVGGDSYAQHVARGSTGVDLRAAIGTAVRAPFDGTLTTSHSQRGGLQAFVTSLDGTMRAGFAHLSSAAAEGVQQGMRVAMGDVVARTGNTGINPRTGNRVDPHLHSSLTINGRSVDPMRYFGRQVDLGRGGAAVQAQAAQTMASALDRIQGLLTPGNIDIMHRPRHVNADGSVSTVRSMSFGTDRGEVLVPTIGEDGRLMSDRQARRQYDRTGRHLGIFDNPEHADAYAQQLHQQQEAMIRAAGTLSDSMQSVKRLVDSLPDDSGIAAQNRRAIDSSLPQGGARQQMGAIQGVIGDLHAAIAGPQGLTGPADRMSSAAAEFAAAVPPSLGMTHEMAHVGPAAPVRALGLRELYNNLGSSIGKNLDHVLGTRFAERIGGKLGDVMVGAGKGQMASGVARMVGIKQSNTGAAIGGAIGQLAAPFLGPLAPFAPFIGGLIGGTIGGMLKKTPHASTTVSVGGFHDFVTGGTSGTSSSLRTAADELGGSVGSGLKSIADALFGEISGSGTVSIGKRKDKFVVDPTGRGRTKGSGVLKFDDEQAAVEAAIKLMIQKGVIGGISAASQSIIQRGKDLQTSIEKAAAIENIPRLLMQMKDPIRFAVMELNREFSKLIDYLREGGASAEQFAQAEELYRLQRAKAIEEAKNQASDQIQSFLDDMLGGQNSPLSKRDIYNNSREQIDRFTSDINAGQVVDQTKLLEAARNFQDATRSLNGSSSGFFTDFDWLVDLLNRAKINVNAGGSTEPLPGSPFTSDIQAIIDGYRGTTTAITDQTGILGGLLQQILNAFPTTYTGAGISGGGSSISGLPGFGGMGSSDRQYINLE